MVLAREGDGSLMNSGAFLYRALIIWYTKIGFQDQSVYEFFEVLMSLTNVMSRGGAHPKSVHDVVVE